MGIFHKKIPRNIYRGRNFRGTTSFCLHLTKTDLARFSKPLCCNGHTRRSLLGKIPLGAGLAKRISHISFPSAHSNRRLSFGSGYGYLNSVIAFNIHNKLIILQNNKNVNIFLI